MSFTSPRLRFSLPLLLLLAATVLFGPRPHPAAADGGIILVASLGDSIASGEGAPDVAKGPNPWDQPVWAGGVASPSPTLCHRSNKAGPAQAYYTRIKPVYQTSYFLHVACSGAGIVNGIMNPQLYDDRTVKVGTPQIAQLRNWLTSNFAGRRLDALFLSIGANDINFAPIVTHCLWVTSCENDTDFVNGVTMDISNLDRLYDDLAATIRTQISPAPLKIFISEYPDPTRKDASQFCNAEPSGDTLNRITGDEAQWASQFVVANLNAKIRAAAQRHAADGWVAVPAAADFIGHAYCSATPWINTMTASNAVQGDDYGTVHPNYAGHALYRDHLASAFFAAYPPPTTVPAAPSNLADTVTFIGEVEKHTLSWRDNSTNETQFVLSYQAAGASSWTTVTLNYNTTKYALGRAFSIGQTYSFFVQACNAYGCSLPTDTIDVAL